VDASSEEEELDILKYINHHPNWWTVLDDKHFQQGPIQEETFVVFSMGLCTS